MKKLVSVLMIAVFVFLLGCTNEKDTENENKENNKTVAENTIAVDEQKAVYDKEELEALINEAIDKKRGNWSVYVEVPGSDVVVEINNGAVNAASVIKLFNMVTLYNEVNKGDIVLNEHIEKNLNLMITESSNDASNEIVKIIGKGSFNKGAKAVTKFAHELGCPDTKEEHMLHSTKITSSGQNRISVRDSALVLKKIYNKECISEEYDVQMMDLLKAQKRKWKIPANLPEETVVANKTGENSRVEADVGIVFSPNCDYIICVAVTNFGNAKTKEDIAEFSRIIYDYFNAEK